MTFSVNTRALAGLPAHLDRRRDDLTAARDYVSRHTRLVAGGGLTARNVIVHEAIIGSVLRYLTDAASIYADGDADRVRVALASYSGADVRAAGRADAALPSWRGELPTPPKAPSDARLLGPEAFADSAQPRFDLSPPGDHALDMPYHPSWSDLLSPTSLLRDAIYDISRVASAVGLLPHPIDAFDMILRPFVGDWAGMLRVAEVFDNVALLLGDVAEQIDRVDSYVPLVWSGNAADGCRAALIHFAVGLRIGLVRLHYIASVYRDVAEGVRANSRLIESILVMGGDELVDGAIDIATSSVGLIFSIANQIGDEISLIQQMRRLTAATLSIVVHGFSLTDSTAHRLGILTPEDLMPDMTRPFPVPRPQTTRKPFAYA